MGASREIQGSTSNGRVLATPLVAADPRPTREKSSAVRWSAKPPRRSGHPARPNTKETNHESEVTRYTGRQPDRETVAVRQFSHWPCHSFSWPRSLAKHVSMHQGPPMAFGQLFI